MRSILIFLPVVLLAQTPAPTPKPAAAAPSAARPPAASPAAAPKPMTDDEKTIYALGLSVYRSLAQFDLSPAELTVVKQALTDAEANKPEVDVSVWGPKIEAMAHARA